MKIDIGGGNIPAPGYINLDPWHGEGEWKRYAQDAPWPVEDNSVDHIRAIHVMEHIPAGEPRITVFNEAWRVLKPGHEFEVVLPLFPHPLAVADPTHVSFWVKESFDYFTRPIANADYGISYWEQVQWFVAAGFEGHWVGRKPR